MVNWLCIASISLGLFAFENVAAGSIEADKPTPMPAGHIKQVAIANSPLTQPVLACIENLALPNGIQNQIDQQQFGENVRDLLKREVIYKTAELNDLESGMVRVFLELDSIEGAKEVLKSSEFLHSKKTLAELEIAGGNFTRARALNDSIGNLGGDENTNYAALGSVLIDLAEKAPEVPNLASSHAKSILRLVFNEDFPIIPPTVPMLKMGPDDPVQSEEYDKPLLAGETVYFGKNYPDPFFDVTYIPYFVPENSPRTALKIFNLEGSPRSP